MILYFVVNTCIASDNLFATARFPCVNLRITENLPVSRRILPPVKVMFLTLEKLFSKDFPKLPVKQIIKLKIKCQIKNQEPPSPPKKFSCFSSSGVTICWFLFVLHHCQCLQALYKISAFNNGKKANSAPINDTRLFRDIVKT